jgi:hypothetical protein
VFGDGDVLGSLNLLTPDQVIEGARLIRAGETISLDLPLDIPDPPLFGRRSYRHHIVALSRNEMDDHLDDFHLQGSTQWDALNHVRCREHGYWGGRTQDPTDGPNGLGIDQWAEHGIAGRGLLIDVAGWFEAQGRNWNPLEPYAITTQEIAATLEAQGVEPAIGDIWCLRTGWVRAYRQLDAPTRALYARHPVFAGLHAGEEMARRIWNAHPAALCCDNPAVEVVPGDPAVGSLHRRLLPTLGLALGEMFDFERLARSCRSAGRWTFFFTAAPLKVPGGVGSPGNALAIL